MDIVQVQPFVAVAALFGGLYAAYDLARLGGSWWRRPIQVLAALWVVVLLVTVGVEYLLFGNSAVLLVARQFGWPTHVVQAGFVGSLVIAVLVWARSE